MQLETRTVEVFAHTDPLEVRAAEGDKPARLVGYAAVFHSMSADLGGFRERILPHAFNDTLTRKSDVRALVDHDHVKLLGRTSAGTLRLEEDGKGLRVEVDLPDVSYARDLLTLMKRGDVRGMSFGFSVAKGGDRFVTEAGKPIRELTKIDLREVSVTSIPAYGATSVSVRVDPSVAARVPTAAPSRRMAERRLKIQNLW